MKQDFWPRQSHVLNCVDFSKPLNSHETNCYTGYNSSVASAVHRHQAQQEAQALIIPSASATARRQQVFSVSAPRSGERIRAESEGSIHIASQTFNWAGLLTVLVKSKESSLFRSTVSYMSKACNSWSLIGRDIEQAPVNGDKSVSHSARCLSLDLYTM